VGELIAAVCFVKSTFKPGPHGQTAHGQTEGVSKKSGRAHGSPVPLVLVLARLLSSLVG
jgi:hypothetical protein